MSSGTRIKLQEIILIWKDKTGNIFLSGILIMAYLKSESIIQMVSMLIVCWCVETGYIVCCCVETGYIVYWCVETGFIVYWCVETGFIVYWCVETGDIVCWYVETGYIFSDNRDKVR